MGACGAWRVTSPENAAIKFTDYIEGSFQDRKRYKRQVEEIARLRGADVRPDPPRDVFAQAASRKVLVTWKAPADDSNISGWRVYKGTEKNLYASIDDRNCRQAEVSLTSGASPEVTGIFVSSVNKLGSESRRVQVITNATAEAGAPAEATPPPGYENEPDGGDPPDIDERLGNRTL
jgi:hypothetical protein